MERSHKNYYGGGDYSDPGRHATIHPVGRHAAEVVEKGASLSTMTIFGVASKELQAYHYEAGGREFEREHPRKCFRRDRE